MYVHIIAWQRDEVSSKSQSVYSSCNARRKTRLKPGDWTVLALSERNYQQRLPTLNIKNSGRGLPSYKPSTKWQIKLHLCLQMKILFNSNQNWKCWSYLSEMDRQTKANSTLLLPLRVRVGTKSYVETKCTYFCRPLYNFWNATISAERGRAARAIHEKSGSLKTHHFKKEYLIHKRILQILVI